MFRLPPPYLWTPLSPQRVKGCSPLTIPKMRSKPKNASRFAKRIFLCFSHLRLRRRFHASAGHYRQQRGNTSCEAANRRNEKKALSAATSFFPFRQPLWDYQGRAALDSCLPRLESSGRFSGSLLARKRELSLAQLRSILRRRRKNHSSVICSPSSSARISAPVAGRLRTR